MLINKKDIIRINQEIGETGDFTNEGNLDFCISIISRGNKSWLYELAYLTRLLLVDHAFMDGNKRTALVLIVLYFEHHGREFDKLRLLYLIRKIAKNNLTNINRIMRMINNVTS